MATCVHEFLQKTQVWQEQLPNGQDRESLLRGACDLRTHLDMVLSKSLKNPAIKNEVCKQVLARLTSCVVTTASVWLQGLVQAVGTAEAEAKAQQVLTPGLPGLEGLLTSLRLSKDIGQIAGREIGDTLAELMDVMPDYVKVKTATEANTNLMGAETAEACRKFCSQVEEQLEEGFNAFKACMGQLRTLADKYAQLALNELLQCCVCLSVCR